MTATSVIPGIAAHTPFLQSPVEPTIPWGVGLLEKTFYNYLNAIGLDTSTDEARCRALLIACLGTEGQRILYTFDQTSITTLSEVKVVRKS